MLIDDPIAHIDDLNSLSFLDYLREIVIRGTAKYFLQRQMTSSHPSSSESLISLAMSFVASHCCVQAAS
jgi:hypothetical protein